MLMHRDLDNYILLKLPLHIKFFACVPKKFPLPYLSFFNKVIFFQPASQDQISRRKTEKVKKNKYKDEKWKREKKVKNALMSFSSSFLTLMHTSFAFECLAWCFIWQFHDVTAISNAASNKSWWERSNASLQLTSRRHLRYAGNDGLKKYAGIFLHPFFLHTRQSFSFEETT